MRMVVIGLGIQGHKRRAIADAEVVATIDPVNPKADYADLKQVDPASFDGAFVCNLDIQQL